MFARANSGAITKLVQGCRRYWSRSLAEIAVVTPSCAERASSGVGCSRNERASSVARSRSLRAGGAALIARPTSRPASSGSTPDSCSAIHAPTASTAMPGARHETGAQGAQVELAPRLQADDEEEERHQRLAHPLAQLQRDALAPDLDRELRGPEGVVRVRPGGIGPGQGGDHCTEERHGAGGLRAEEVPHGRGEVARPGGAPREGTSCDGGHLATILTPS